MAAVQISILQYTHADLNSADYNIHENNLIPIYKWPIFLRLSVLKFCSE